MKTSPQERRLLLGILLSSGLISLLVSFLLPITLDEAYYFFWSHSLAWGYFDHPPAVSFLSALSPQWSLALIGPRLGNIMLGIATLALAWRFFKNAGLRGKQLFLASFLLKFNLACLALGVLTTPDSFLCFFWILALHEAHQACTRNPLRWISAGLACGLGLLSKYSMVLMGLVFLVVLVSQRREHLKQPWPYLGGLLAFFILLPNLYWNSNNGWPAINFQLGRLTKTAVANSTDLPKPNSDYLSLEDLSIKQWLDKHDPETPQSPPSSNIKHPLLPEALSRLLEFLGGSIVLWGLLLIPFLTPLLRRRKLFIRDLETDWPTKTLLISASIVPLAFFALISLFTKAEANWAALYMVGAAPLLSFQLTDKVKSVIIAGILNALALLALAVHSTHPFLPLKRDRVLTETFGFQHLAKHLDTVEDPIFADTYQLASMMNYYNPAKKVLQWPDINRPSEFTNNPEYRYPLSLLSQNQNFWLISSDHRPPRFLQFKPISVDLIKDCKDGKLFLKPSIPDTDAATRQVPPSDCPSVHRWILVHYKLSAN